MKFQRCWSRAEVDGESAHTPRDLDVRHTAIRSCSTMTHSDDPNDKPSVEQLIQAGIEFAHLDEQVKRQARAASQKSWLEDPEAAVEARALRGIRGARLEGDSKEAVSGEDSLRDRLAFHDGAAAFEYCCRYMDTRLVEGATLPALVLDAREYAGTHQAIRVDEDGAQLAVLRVASRDGGFVVVARTASGEGPALHPGHLVAWQAMTDRRDIGEQTEDPRGGWIGLILGTLRPEWQAGQWVGGERF